MPKFQSNFSIHWFEMFQLFNSYSNDLIRRLINFLKCYNNESLKPNLYRAKPSIYIHIYIFIGIYLDLTLINH